MSKAASMLGYRHGRKRNLGSSYFCFGVVFWGYFFVVLFVCLWGGLFFCFLLFCFVGIFFSSVLVLSFVWVVLWFFFLIQGCGEGKPNIKKPLTFLHPAHP